MSAGAVRAPIILPLRVPEAGVPKSVIDTNTRLDMLSETANVGIYFTLNGKKPVVGRTERDSLKHGTHKFCDPFTLPAGTQTLRAMAFVP